jgi:hypothetical protein
MEYEINSLFDFLKVPENKQAECLEDFGTWLTLCRNAGSIKADLAEEFPGISASLSTEGFVWIDDGAQGVSDVSFSVNGEEIARASGRKA